MPHTKVSDPSDPLVKTSVSIKRSQKEWAEENHINISSLLRNTLEKLMKKVTYV